MLLQVKNLIKIITKFRAEKKLCTFVSCTKHPFEAQNIVLKVVINSLKMN